MSKSSDDSINFGIGLLFGVVAGVVGGVLFAPKAGEEMRKAIKETAGEVAKNVSPDVETTKEKSLDMIDKIKYNLEAKFNKINENIKAQKLASAKDKEAKSYEEE